MKEEEEEEKKVKEEEERTEGARERRKKFSKLYIFVREHSTYWGNTYGQLINHYCEPCS